MGDYKNYDFGTADTNAKGGSELIPDGTLAWAIVTVRPHNARDCLTPSQSSEGKYLDVELTILEGKYARRKVWDKIGLEGSEKWVARGMSSVRHILEVGRRMTSFEPGQPGYRLGASGAVGDMVFMELNELQCAVKIGVEKDKSGNYPDKNSVRAYLSPNPTSDTHKAFQKLVAGETEPAVLAAARPAAASRPAWGPGAGADTQASRPASPPPAATRGRPEWAGSRPPAQQRQALDDDIPF